MGRLAFPGKRQNLRYPTFSTNCLVQKSVIQNRNAFTGVFAESSRDSFIYDNAVLKSYTIIRPEFTAQNTISRSKDLKSDTIFTIQKVNGVVTETYRKILYRNQKGLDSITTNQELKNGTWINAIDLFEVFYDAQSREIQVKSSQNTMGRERNFTTTYTYTNNKLVTKIDTSFSGGSKVFSVTKLDYTYNAKGLVSEVLISYWDSFGTQPQYVLTPVRRFRKTAFNTKDKVTAESVDFWTNGSWVETVRIENVYVNDTSVVKINEYANTNNAWWIKIRNTYEYCGLVNSIKDVPTFDFNIAPNPTQNIINITSSEIVDANNKVFIFNSSGVQVVQKNDVTLPASIDLNFFSEGMYFMKFVNGKGVSEIKKFVVVR